MSDKDGIDEETGTVDVYSLCPNQGDSITIINCGTHYEMRHRQWVFGEIELTDKAVARLRDQNPKYKRLIMRRWMGHVPIFELAVELRCDDRRAKELLGRAELQVGRNIIMLESGLTEKYFKRKIRSVSSGKRAL